MWVWNCGVDVADERVFYAGDLGTQHLRHDVVLNDLVVPVDGLLLGVHHCIARATGEPMTVLALEGEAEYPWGPPERALTVSANTRVVVKTMAPGATVLTALEVAMVRKLRQRGFEDTTIAISVAGSREVPTPLDLIDAAVRAVPRS